jgi:hypothetical protein
MLFRLPDNSEAMLARGNAVQGQSRSVHVAIADRFKLLDAISFGDLVECREVEAVRSEAAV